MNIDQQIECHIRLMEARDRLISAIIVALIPWLVAFAIAFSLATYRESLPDRIREVPMLNAFTAFMLAASVIYFSKKLRIAYDVYARLKRDAKNFLN